MGIDTEKQNVNKELLPDYLKSLSALEQHFRAELEELSPVGKGTRFAQFTQRLIPQTDLGKQFQEPKINERHSYDEGVDLIAKDTAEESTLYIQAKTRIDTVDDFDTIISKFDAFLKNKSKTGDREEPLLNLIDTSEAHFLIVTLSPLENIIDRFGKSRRHTKDFYTRYRSKDQFHFIDGYDILDILKATYTKVNEIPADLTLELHSRPIQQDNVFFGIISSKELRALYDEFGDALFFENIRDFLGEQPNQERYGRTTPNQEIIKTITQNPGKMLERNNGIAFRADKVHIDETNNRLILDRGSVVNGCQTTMCIVEYAYETCYVPIKVVETENSWDVAKAANFQNHVYDIDLELASHLRPQLVKKAGAQAGVHVTDGPGSAFQVIDVIYNQKVAYEELRLLFIGLFSRTPNNLFSSNYTELRYDLINDMYQEDPEGLQIFDTLFLVQGSSRDAVEQARETFTHDEYASLFNRFYSADSPKYRCFISLLAMCGATEVNIADHSENIISSDAMLAFLNAVRDIVENRDELFKTYYSYALKIWILNMLQIGSDDEVRQRMYSKTEESNFTSLFKQLCAEADLHNIA